MQFYKWECLERIWRTLGSADLFGKFLLFSKLFSLHILFMYVSYEHYPHKAGQDRTGQDKTRLVLNNLQLKSQCFTHFVQFIPLSRYRFSIRLVCYVLRKQIFTCIGDKTMSFVLKLWNTLAHLPLQTSWLVEGDTHFEPQWLVESSTSSNYRWTRTQDHMALLSKWERCQNSKRGWFPVSAWQQVPCDKIAWHAFCCWQASLEVEAELVMRLKVKV
jgi:hypothetical protein